MPDRSPQKPAKPGPPDASRSGQPGGKPPAKSGASSGGGVDPVLDKLVSDSPMITASPCPGCGNPMAGAAKICTMCGHDLATGKSVRTRVVRAPKAAPQQSGGSRGSAIAIGEINPLIPTGIILLLHVGLAIYFGTNPNEETAKVFVYAGSGLWIAIVLYIVVTAFRTGNAIWGLVALGMFLPCFNIIMLIGLCYYLFAISDDRLGRYAFLANIIGTILGWTLAFTLAGETLRDAELNPFGGGSQTETLPDEAPEDAPKWNIPNQGGSTPR
jgi:hypothetical protein